MCELFVATDLPGSGNLSAAHGIILEAGYMSITRRPASQVPSAYQSRSPKKQPVMGKCIYNSNVINELF